MILLAGCGLAGASDDGIPALLKFAERQQAPAVKPAAPAPRAEPGAARPGNASPPAGDSLRLTTLNQTLRQQAETIRRLERQLAERKALPAPPPKITEIDIRPLARSPRRWRRRSNSAPLWPANWRSSSSGKQHGYGGWSSSWRRGKRRLNRRR
ncbi:hypothetical protein [Serratia ficaria]|uniref:hypothetical protein n=1 Tax=Serratia ficaria TaxID=61651 RepID=UPI0021BB1DFD|nr:hypothetical protein [Serratia ficaria]